MLLDSSAHSALHCLIETFSNVGKNPSSSFFFSLCPWLDLGALIHNFSPELKQEVRDLEKVSIR